MWALVGPEWPVCTDDVGVAGRPSLDIRVDRRSSHDDELSRFLCLRFLPRLSAVERFRPWSNRRFTAGCVCNGCEYIGCKRGNGGGHQVGVSDSFFRATLP